MGEVFRQDAGTNVPTFLKWVRQVIMLKITFLDPINDVLDQVLVYAAATVYIAKLFSKIFASQPYGGSLAPEREVCRQRGKFGTRGGSFGAREMKL